MNKILVIIPARGGSKGIKNKNILKVQNKPLIHYTIAPALIAKSQGIVDEVIVSTDDHKIAEISRRYGAEVPFLRPKNISGDKAKSVDVVLHALSVLEKKKKFYKNVVLLQPTSPMRNFEDISNSIKLYLKYNLSSLISAHVEKGLISSIIYTKEDACAIPVKSNHNIGIRRQEADELYVRNGAIYIVAASYVKKYKKIISNKPLLFEMPKDRSINIDTSDDLRSLKKILKKSVNGV